MPADTMINHEFLSDNPMSIEITNCRVSQNTKNGITISDWWKGEIMVTRSKILENKGAGISAQYSRIPMPRPTNQFDESSNEETESENGPVATSRNLVTQKSPPSICLGKLWINKNTKITQNNVGVYLRNCVCHIDEQNLEIYDNTRMQQVISEFDDSKKSSKILTPLAIALDDQQLSGTQIKSRRLNCFRCIYQCLMQQKRNKVIPNISN